ncbi:MULTISPECIES: hypothetical protein [unclassified Cellulophaga]|uniref:hypothetical protein n=1 Tax=unclassified Cellulophaga TaxID=2634405 RepID=UPI0026E1926E|nr:MULTISPECIES: hypothetical protein [unclassified Cellulophaga]MDO6492490.1 hypothetical protein [Cellulophaga sp. 2_MG-2023]MDO6493592.1 hypothetical protein [Cellulophaga sp. 3_MG-2023]
MNSFFSIVKLDYIQRTRSYAFLITLCASLAIAYTFVPEPNANYSTIRIADYIGVYNSAWFGYVTAIMTSIFLSLIGFYLVNSAIKTDINTKVGQIIATTRIKNFSYLLSKVLSNFLVLLTIALVVFIMSIILFFLYNDNYSFNLLQFIKPYALITAPALFCIAVIAVVFELVLSKYSVLQNVLFFIIYSTLILFSPKTENSYTLDILGSNVVIHQLEKQVKTITKSTTDTNLAIGYIVGNTSNLNKFEFNGIDFPTSFVVSRFLLVVLGLIIILVLSKFFHRFNITKYSTSKEQEKSINKPNTTHQINLKELSNAQINYSIYPLLKAEMLLILRKGKKWLWIINILGMLLLLFLPIAVSFKFILPILWFLQVHRISDLSVKETTYNVDYFSYSAYKPISRVLFSQLLAGVCLFIFLALPLILRLAINLNFSSVVSILLGSIFIVLLVVTLGILSKGKKLFEVLFFMITYANINNINYADYFGALGSTNLFNCKMMLLLVSLSTFCIIARKRELKK